MVVVIDGETGVFAREQRRVRVDIDAGLAADDVFARRERGAHHLGTVEGEDNFRERDVHGGAS